MRGHHLAVGLLHLAVAACVGVAVALLWGVADQLTPLVADTFVADLVRLFGRPLAVAALIFAGLELIAGMGALAAQRWARALLLPLSALLALAFPVGTGIAVYTLWVLLRNDPADAGR